MSTHRKIVQEKAKDSPSPLSQLFLDLRNDEFEPQKLIGCLLKLDLLLWFHTDKKWKKNRETYNQVKKECKAS